MMGPPLPSSAILSGLVADAVGWEFGFGYGNTVYK
jgi:hypothetical protein